MSISPTFYEQLFGTYGLGLNFFGERKLVQKLLVKCLWNWLLESLIRQHTNANFFSFSPNFKRALKPFYHYLRREWLNFSELCFLYFFEIHFFNGKKNSEAFKVRQKSCWYVVVAVVKGGALSLKTSCHMLFMHAFTALHCIFE